MDPTVKARKRAVAQERMNAALTTLAERHGLHSHVEALEAAGRAQLSVRDVFGIEAMADLLEALVDAGEPAPEPEPEPEKPAKGKKAP